MEEAPCRPAPATTRSAATTTKATVPATSARGARVVASLSSSARTRLVMTGSGGVSGDVGVPEADQAGDGQRDRVGGEDERGEPRRQEAGDVRARQTGRGAP